MVSYVKAYMAKKMSWATWQFSVLKVAMISFGILIGSYFADFWKPLLPVVWVVFIITVVWVSVMWLKHVMVSKSNKRVMKK